MPRNLNSSMAAALASGAIQPFFMAQLSFKSSKQYIWTGVGSLVYNAQTYIGVGSFAKLGVIQEGSNVEAYGTSVTLSGIDPLLLQSSMTDIQPGAQATISLGLMASGTIIGAPYLLFSGTMDQPSVEVGPDTVSITLALENRMIDLSRANNRRYTSADQRLYHPTDIAFSWVEQLNDLSLIWGS